jgi:hypothetical protein
MSTSLEQLERQLGIDEGFPSLEELVTSAKPAGVGVKTATPVQRAIMCVLDGVPIRDELWDDPWEDFAVRKTFGDVRPSVTDEAQVLSGVRGLKTVMAVCAAIRMTQRVTFPTDLVAGEEPRVNFVSERLDLAQAALKYLKGFMRTVECCKKILVEDPTEGSDHVRVYHPSGNIIEIKVVAASRAGSTLVSRWCAGVLFDEAPRMSSNEDSVKGIEEMLYAVRSRMLPGALIMFVGSPVGRIGPMYKMFTDNFGKAGVPVTVARAKGPWLNPFWWTEARMKALREKDFDTYLTDVEADFRDVETSFFSSRSIENCIRQHPLVAAPEKGRKYTCVIDPATRRNAWTMGVADTTDNVRFRLCLAMQWIGTTSAPLSPRAVFKEMKPILEQYGIATCISDQYAADAMRDIALMESIGLTSITITPKLKMAMFQSLRTRVDSGLIELTPEPVMRDDLVNVRLRINRNGDPTIILPETADGRHCDYAAMLGLLCGSYIEVSDGTEASERSPAENSALDPLEDEGEEPRAWYDDDDQLEAANW